MRTRNVKTNLLSKEEYWENFERLINSADLGTVLASTGWILFWFDHIPGHFFHMHVFTIAVFAAAFMAGIRGAWIIVRAGGWLGTKGDRRLHFLMVFYTIVAAVTGIVSYVIFPAH